MSRIVIERSAPSPQAFTTRSARWLAASALITGAALQVVEFSLSHLDIDSAARVSYWVAHPTQTGASMTVGLLAVPSLMAGFAVTLTQAQPDSHRLAIVAAASSPWR